MVEIIVPLVQDDATGHAQERKASDHRMAAILQPAEAHLDVHRTFTQKRPFQPPGPRENRHRSGRNHAATTAVLYGTPYFVEQSANESLIADQVGYVPQSQSVMEEELSALNDAISSAQS